MIKSAVCILLVGSLLISGCEQPCDQLTRYLRQFKAGMTKAEVKQLIPDEFLLEERACSGTNAYVGRTFQKGDTRLKTELLFRCHDDSIVLSVAVVYFDDQDRIVGFDYDGSSEFHIGPDGQTLRFKIGQ